MQDAERGEQLLRDQQRGAQQLLELQQRRELEGPPKDKSVPPGSAGHVRQLFVSPLHSSSPSLSLPDPEGPNDDLELDNNSAMARTSVIDLVPSIPVGPRIIQKRRQRQVPSNSRKKSNPVRPPPGRIDEAEQKQYASLRVRITTQLNGMSSIFRSVILDLPRSAFFVNSLERT
jgi:hypothetical protein